MIVVYVRWVVREDYVWFALPNGVFDILNDFQMRNGIEVDVLEVTHAKQLSTKDSSGLAHVAPQLLIRRPQNPSPYRTRQYADGHLNARISHTPHGTSATQHLIVRVCHNNQDAAYIEHTITGPHGIQ